MATETELELTPEAQHSSKVDIRIIIEYSRKQNCFSRLPVNHGSTYAQIMRAIAAKYSQDVHGPMVIGLHHYLWCQELILESVSMSSVTFTDEDLHILPVLVFLLPGATDRGLTEAYRRPEIMSSSRAFLETHPEFCISVGMGNVSEARAIFIRRNFIKVQAAVLLFPTMLLFIAIGVVIGVVTRKAELGVAVGAGLFAVILGSHAVLAWVFH